MENNGFNIPMGMPGENFIIPDENFQSATMVSFNQKSYLDQNHQIMPEFHMLSVIPNEPINVTGVTNPTEHLGSNFPSNDQMDVSISATSLASLLASRHGQHESFNCATFGQSLEIPKCVVPNNNFPGIFGYDGTLNDMSKWEFNKFLTPITERTGFNSYPNGLISRDNNPSVSSDGKELSLGLATCSGMSCNNNSQSSGFDSNTNRPIQVLQRSSGSNGYFHIMQEILKEIASYSLGNLDKMNYKQISFDEISEVNNQFDHQFNPVLKSYSIEEKKKHLLALLEMVCHQETRLS